MKLFRNSSLIIPSNSDKFFLAANNVSGLNDPLPVRSGSTVVRPTRSFFVSSSAELGRTCCQQHRVFLGISQIILG